MNDMYEAFITALIHEKPGGFFRYTGGSGRIIMGLPGPWEPFRFGGMSDWVFEFDMPKTSFAIYPHLLVDLEHYRIPFTAKTAVQVNETQKMLRDGGVYGVSVFNQDTHATEFLVFFDERDAILAQSLLELK